MSSYLYALACNFCWGLGTQVFAVFSKKVSPVWMTVFKGLAGWFLFLGTALCLGGFHPIEIKYVSVFMLSGFIGLGLGDIFIFKAFAEMGPGRTLVLFAFQPLVVGVISRFVFGQSVSGAKFFGVIFFCVCVFIFALEQFKKTGRWSFAPAAAAFLGMMLDSAGIILTRLAFDGSGVSAWEGCFYRSCGAAVCFFIICSAFKIRFFKKLKRMSARALCTAFTGAFLGCYMALAFYLTAIKNGNLAGITGIAVTGVLFASFFECLFSRKKPSKYLLWSFAFFAAGMYFLLRYD